MKKGMLIVVEGSCDGIGKTTQFNLLCERLKKEGHDVVNHHFPTYNSYQGAPVEKYLKGDFGKPSEISNYFVNSLYAVDRGVTWYSKLKKDFDSGKTIILDRYTTSSIIYQSALIEDEEEKKEFINFVNDFEYNKIGIKEPDLVIFLHVPFDIATKIRNERKQNDGIENDVYERDEELLKKVYKSAVFVADYLSWDTIECSENENMREIKSIHEEMYNKIKNISEKL
ncbi:MAG: thymidylate kinase [Bacilli bacterium]|nr:thymidylate kinase [Bacilli bacterium]